MLRQPIERADPTLIIVSGGHELVTDAVVNDGDLLRRRVAIAHQVRACRFGDRDDVRCSTGVPTCCQIQHQTLAKGMGVRFVQIPQIVNRHD
jgi:hypothetical protein